MVAGHDEGTVTIRLLVDAVVNLKQRKARDEVDVAPGVAGRFISVGRAEIVSTTEDEKLPAVGSVAAPHVETVQVEVDNTPKNDLVHVPVDVPVVAKAAKAAKATPVTPASTDVVEPAKVTA